MLFFKLFNKRKKRVKLKEQIQIEQKENWIYISGKLSKTTFSVKGLKFHINGESNAPLIIENEEYNNHFLFSINLDEYVEKFELDEKIYQLSLIVHVHKENLSESQINNLINKPTTFLMSNGGIFEYPIRLGRFEKTYTGEMTNSIIKTNTFRLYKSIKGNISLAVNKEINQQYKTQIDYLKSKKNEIRFGGKLFTRTERVKEIKLLVIGRENNLETFFPVDIEQMIKETHNRFGLNRYRYKTHINFDDLFADSSLTDDIYDLYFELEFYGRKSVEKKLVRVGKPRFRARFNLKSSRGVAEDKVMSVSPYYTFRGINLSLQANSFEKDVYQYLRRVMRFSFLLKLWNKKKNIWVVGERPYKAQDTGYHFFKYVREKHPQKNVYYVIDAESPELPNVTPFENVVYFKSKEHIKKIVSASRIIGSHHPDYLYPLRTKEFKNKVKAEKVFLQHGIMGTKNMVANYGKTASGFETDLFLVSSQNEKEIIVNDFGYDANDVKITGLSRFDSLFKQDVKLKRQLLIIPTWREWLIREDLFLESDYYQYYWKLVNNTKLHALAEKFNFEILFCLHPNMQNFSHLFNDAPVKVVNQGEVDVQTLLKESIMMITDYSSVAFDFSFLEKPIIYYQFDHNRFIGKRPSHLDLESDLPGDIVYEGEEKVISLVQKYAEKDFLMNPVYKQRLAKFLKFKDQRSSERIYQAILEGKEKKPFHQVIQENDLYKTLFNRFRKSKHYFPLMKRFYNVAKRVLPVDEKLILFESGVGKQYGDSPKIIYDEIVERGLDYKKVWVVNVNARFKDIDNTKKIKRLSPSYFYYLARAKMWVNNQNFPTYIDKRPETTYLQTWHGTPLKKMLYDIEKVQGRSNDYVERVGKAIKNWDYLISPSEYASNAFRSAFQYEGEILETGYPRNDLFYSDNQDKFKEKVLNKLYIPKGKKVILYAPTFRDNQTSKKNKFLFDIEMDLHKMQENLGEEYIMLLRMHVVVSNKIKVDEDLSDFVIDVSKYPDMQELLMISDLLITDYSSVMFDFANTKKPMLFFTYDFETYKNEVRGFYLDFEKEAPGPFVKNTDEIIECIYELDKYTDKYKEIYNNFYNKFCYLEDGRASKRVVDYMFDNHNSIIQQK